MQQKSIKSLARVGLLLGTMGGLSASFTPAQGGEFFATLITVQTVVGLFGSVTTQEAELRDRSRTSYHHYHYYYYKLAVETETDIKSYRETNELSPRLSELLSKLSQKHPEKSQNEHINMLEEAIEKIKKENGDTP